jgi:hypothetical protein
MPELRVALFVEGSTAPPSPRGRQALERIWNDDLGATLGLRRFEPIVPISKPHLTSMDPRRPPISGAGERLDQLMVRTLRSKPFDVAVVAWDLVPAWNPHGDFCRWTETVDLYRFLAESDTLPDLWKDQARRRHEELSRRSTPSERGTPPRIELGMVLPLCMEPMFEGMLVLSEAALRRALGVQGARIPDWPKRGWGNPQERHPDDRVLAPAIRALGRMRPRPPVLQIVRGDMTTNKDGWGEFLLRKFLADQDVRSDLLDHPFAKRLAELAPRERAGL